MAATAAMSGSRCGRAADGRAICRQRCATTARAFPPGAVPRLTERFYRVDVKRSREQGGTGLGLAIVKHIVSRHQGRLTIESRPGEGSTFTVFLPAARRRKAPKTAGPAAPVTEVL